MAISQIASYLNSGATHSVFPSRCGPINIRPWPIKRSAVSH